MARVALTFSTHDLNQLGVTNEQLSPFIFTANSRSSLASQQIGHTEIERCPIVGCGSDIVLVLPHAVIPCAERYLVDSLDASGFLDQYAGMLHAQQAERWVQMMRHGLDFEPCDLELPKLPDGLPPIYQTVMTFDVGKFAYVLMLDGNLRGHKTDANAVDRLTDEQTAAWQQHLHECIQAIKRQPGFSGGITLVSRGGFGRAFAIEKGTLADWGVIVAPLPDWETLARCEDLSALRLWRMWRQQTWAEAHDLTITNENGILNLFAFWRANHWRFLIRDIPLKQPHKMIVTPTDMLKDIREEVRGNYDLHTCPPYTGVGAWWRVERKSAKAYFRDDKRSPVYIAPDAVKNKELLAVIETPQRNWWVSCVAETKTSEERSTVFQLWECLLQWMERAAPVAEQMLTFLPQKSIRVELQVRDLDVWTQEGLPNADAPVIPELVVDKENRVLRVGLAAGFKREFHVPENRAERALVACVLNGCARIAGMPLPESLRDELLARILPNAHARYFHLVITHNLAQMLVPGSRPDHDFIAEEDCAQSLIGLADEIGDLPSGGIIRGERECLVYLEKANTKLWERIESRLKEFNRGEVVNRCFVALAELERDAERWNMTARAMLNLRRDTNEVLRVARKHRSKNDAASLMNRLVIETAMYASELTSDRAMPRAEHLELLAHLRNLVAIANHRDAMSAGFMPAEIRVFPNGELDVNDEFYNSVMLPYVRARTAEDYRDSASQYERWFPEIEREPSPEVNDALARLEGPFLAEFGYSTNQMVLAAHNFGRLAIEKKVLALEFGEREFAAFLQSGCSFKTEEAAAYLHHLSLPPRRAWNKDLPDGMADREVFPWRFRRRLSLLVRPLVLLATTPEKRWLVYPPLVEKSAAYLLHNLADASFPTEHFRSKAMIEYWGEQANRHGHKFTNAVSTELQSLGWNVRSEVTMSSLGVPATDGDLGDVDVIAWKVTPSVVLLIECKRLRPAISVRDVVERLDEYRGERDDSLGKHLRRVEWIRNHPEAIASLTGIESRLLQFRPLLVTSDVVPMQFFKGAPITVDQVVPFDALAAKLKHDY